MISSESLGVGFFSTSVPQDGEAAFHAAPEQDAPFFCVKVMRGPCVAVGLGVGVAASPLPPQ